MDRPVIGSTSVAPALLVLATLTTTALSQLQDSCVEAGFSDCCISSCQLSSGCWCDQSCHVFGDCCADVCSFLSAPTIIRHPEDIFVNVGEQSGLQCIGSPSGLAYQWYKVLMVNSGGNLTELQEILPGESMSTLDFRQVQFSDEGIYRCVVSNSQGMAESDPATVTVSPMGGVHIQPSQVVAAAAMGNNVTFNCSTEGGPNNRIQWHKNGLVLSNESSSLFTITDITLEDGAEYSCLVSNTAGSESVNASLFIIPEIVQQPQSINTTNGTVIDFMCLATGYPSPVYHWEKVNSSGAVVVMMVGITSIFNFEPVLFGDEGYYHCVAFLDELDTMDQMMYAAKSDIALLTISPEGGVQINPRTVIEHIGDDTAFTCAVQGGPDNAVHWFKDTIPLLNETDVKLIISMIIPVSDGGDYTCLVVNLAGNESAMVSLYVQPEITLQPINISTTVGNNVSFTCEADGFPMPTLRWERKEGNSFTQIQGATNETLAFEPAIFIDGGRYQCIATVNFPEGPIDMNSTTSTIATLTISPENITTIPDEDNVAVGSTAVFSCTAFGGPDNVFTWIRLSDGVTVANIPVLTVLVGNAYDGSTYRCRVMNPAGNISKDITLNVAPVILIQPSSRNVTFLEESISLSCNASGFPVPTISWSHNGTDITITTVPRLSVVVQEGTRSILSTLVVNASIVNVNDSGEYVCSASSSIAVFGDATSDRATILVQDTPGQPQDLSAVVLNSTAIELTWTEPHDNNAPITGYIVQYQQPLFLGGNEVNRTLPPEPEITVLVELHPGTTYVIIVKAFNNVGAGNPSAQATARTFEESPSGSPQNSSILNTSSTAISLSWDSVAEESQNGIITMYEVIIYDPQETFAETIGIKSVNTTNMSVVISNLQEYVVYSVSVRAYTSAGAGPFSAEILIRTLEDVPSEPPYNVITTANSSTSIQVSWSEVPAIDRNGIITQYEVVYEPLETFAGQIATRTNITDNSTFEILIENLQEYIQYNITVRAYTVREGPFSPEFTVRTFEDVPSESPRMFNATAVGTTSIQVRWDEVQAIDRNGIITSYEVVNEPLETFGGQIATYMNITDASTLSLFLESLEEYVEYNITIRAYTSVGAGSFSTPITVRTNEDVPLGTPVNITAIAVNSTAIQLSWSEVPAIKQNGIITQYEVVFAPLETFGEQIAAASMNITDASILFIILDSLQEYVQYSSTIRAYTNVGKGPFSTATIIQTPEDAPSQPPANFNITVENSTSIRVSWSEIQAIARNGIITQYEVMYEPLETFGGQIAKRSSIVNDSIFTLLLENIQEHVQYNITVRAYTEVGEGPFTSTITVRTPEAAPSSPPSNISALAENSTSISVSWGEVLAINQNGIITQYEVVYEPLETFMKQTVSRISIIVNTTLETLLLNLDEYVEYNITVRAYTFVGEGPFSFAITVRTLEDVPSSPPSNISATAESSTSIRVYWSEVPAIDRNGIITQYQVVYVPLETFGGEIGTRSKITNASFFDLPLDGIQEFTDYNITVTAYTVIGSGPFSLALTVRTFEDAPSSSPSYINATAENSTSIRVSWREVPAIDRNGIITQYDVMYEPLETFGKQLTTNINIINASLFEFILEDLEEYVLHNITVRAYTVIGEGPYSSIITIRTLEDTPSSPPSNVTTTAESSTSIRVRWNKVPAIDRNGIITQYEVVYEPLDTFKGQIAARTNLTLSNQSTLDYLLENLEEYVQYNITIRAYTVEGEGPFSAVTTAWTSEDIPSESPSEFDAIAVNSTLIQVRWSEVQAIDRNGIITVYEVVYEPLETFGGQISTRRNFTDATTFNLLLGSLEEYVEYNVTIRAYTSVGAGSFSAPITVRTNQSVPSEPPANVTATAYNSTSIQVTWSEVPTIDRNGNIIQYEVVYEPLETFGKQIATARVNVSTLDTFLDNLQEYVQYNITIRAYTEIGEGPFSASTIVITPEDAPSQPPTNTSATVENSTSIRVSWSEVPAIDRNGIITQYEVLYVPLETFGGQIVSRNCRVNGSIFELFLQDLQEYIQYNITVRSYTVAGDGPFSPTITVRTPEAAPSSSPINVSATTVSSISIQVNWSEVPVIDHNGIITEYEVVYEPLETFGGQVAARTNITNNSTFEILVKNLQEYVQYNITVRAYTKVGGGPFSPTITTRTHEAAPSSPPSNVNVTVGSSTSIQVSWSEVPAINRNGIITQYEVVYEPLETFGGTLAARITTTNATTFTVLLNDLQEFVDYKIRVRAHTSVAEGPFSTSITVQTHEDVPSRPPTNASATVNSSTSIQVSWSEVPTMDRNGNITQYEVIYEPLVTFGGELMTMISTTDSSTFDILLQKLQEYIEYNITIRAFTSVGPGPLSSANIIRTDEDAPSNTPSNVNAISESATSIRVSWSDVPAIDRNGIITQYKVVYEPQETFGGMISSNASTIINSSVFEILLKGLQEYVEYNITVQASTAVGGGPFSTNNTVRTLEDVPSKSPTNVTVFVENSTSIHVAWNEVPAIDRNGIITQYEVMYEPLETFGGQLSADMNFTDVSTLGLSLQNLEENIQYNFTVRAYTNAGAGVSSSNMIVTTFEDAPSSSPSNVSAVADSSTSIQVSWSEVSAIDRNGIITQYEVVYEPLETFEGQIGVGMFTLNVSKLDLTIDNLEEYVQYNITVKAYTGSGNGPPSSAITARTFDTVPSGSPTELNATAESSTSIRVSWSEVPAIDRNGIITQYEIVYDPLETFGGKINITSCIVNATSSQFTLRNLEENVVYNISIRAYTAVGGGVFSSVISLRTLEDAPSSPPSNINVTTESSTSIRVSWSEVPSIHRNGMITQYGVMYEPLETFGYETVTSVNITDNSTLEILLHNLQEYVQYNITVRAFTSVGEGPFSSVITVRTLEDVPSSPPSNVSVTAESSTSIHVSWSEVPAIDRNGIVTQYEVVNEPLETFEGRIEAKMKTINSPSFEVLFENLQEYVEYNITIRAFTITGEGPFSHAVSIRTLQDVPSQPPINTSAMVESSTSILVRWREVPAINRNGIIVQYEVLHEPLETFGGQIVTGMKVTNASTFQLVLMNLQEHIQYNISVNAYTDVGSGPYSLAMILMTLEDVPSNPPSNVSATAENSTSIYVNWSEVPAIDRNGIIILYEVVYEPLDTFGGQITMKMHFTPPYIFELTLSILQEYTVYNIFIRAYTTVGEGPFSSTIAVETPEDIPVGTPQDIQAFTISSTEMRIDWKQVNAIDRNGNITHYEVQFTQTKFNESMMRTAVTSGDVFSLVLTNLEEFVMYTVTVRAYTVVGAGPYSINSSSNTTAEAIPTAAPRNLNVSNVTGNSTVLDITWERPVEIGINGHLREYVVLYSIAGDSETNRSVTVPGSTLKATLENLKNFTAYNVYVSATTIGVGPFITGMERTSENVPGVPPQNVEVLTKSSTSIFVRWNPPQVEFLFGIPRGYRIRYTPLHVNGSNQMSRLKNVSYTNTSVLLVGLEEFTNYSIEAAAVTIDAGVYSDAIVNRTNPGPPGPVPEPPPIPQEDITSTSVRVTWKAPLDLNGEIVTYTINLRALGIRSSMRKRRQMGNGLESCIIGETIRNISFDGNTTEATLENLTPFLDYEFSVQAATSAGPGNFSEAQTFSTNESTPTKPRELNITERSSEQLLVTWNHPLCDYGMRTTYTVIYEPLPGPYEPFGNTGTVESPTPLSGSPGNPYTFSLSTTDLTLSGLSPYTEYCITVFASTSAGDGLSSSIVVQTKEIVPNAVTGLTSSSRQNVADPEEVLVFLEWMLPSPRFGFYEIELSYSAEQTPPYPAVRAKSASGSTTLSQNISRFTIERALPYATYIVTVHAVTIQLGLISEAHQITFQSVPIEPSAVVNLRAVSTSFSSLTIQWNLPLQPNSEITLYEVNYRIQPMTDTVNNNQYTEIYIAPSGDDNTLPTSTNITGLQAYTLYAIRVRAIGRWINGANSLSGNFGMEIIRRTHSTTPPPPTIMSDSHTQGLSAGTIMVYLQPPEEIATGPIIFYAIVVVRGGHPPIEPSDLVAGPYTPGAIYYIAAAWDHNHIASVPDTFIVGDGFQTVANNVQYDNVRLNASTLYSIFVRIEIQSDTEEMLIAYSEYTRAVTAAADPTPPLLVIIGVIAGIVVILLLVLAAAVIIIACLYASFKRVSQKSTNKNEVISNEMTNCHDKDDSDVERYSTHESCMRFDDSNYEALSLRSFPPALPPRRSSLTPFSAASDEYDVMHPSTAPEDNPPTSSSAADVYDTIRSSGTPVPVENMVYVDVTA